MTAPVRSRPDSPVRSRPAAPRRPSRSTPAARPAEPSRATSARTTAAQRAYERRTERTRRWRHLVPEVAHSSATVRQVPFVVMVIALLAIGLMATLWLSTRSAEGSYQLGAAQQRNQRLSEQAEALRRDVSAADSASTLAQRAAELGMVPSRDVAHLVVAPDGAVTVIGKPAPASGTPAPAQQPAPAPAPAPPPAPAPAAAQQPAPGPQGIAPGPNPSPTAGGA